jgi:hypothetical protein
MNLSEAQNARIERAELSIRLSIEEVTNLLCSQVDELHLAGSDAVKNYQLVGPAKKKKLSGLINHYRKMPHPFTACVRDNTKRFGPERAKKVCAVLTDLEKGTTKWRSGGKKKKTATAKLSEPLADQPEIDDELFELLSQIADTDYKAALGLEA